MVDGAGNVFVADSSNRTIRKITPASAVTTLAGRAGWSGSADGTGATARFAWPSGVAVDGAGNVLCCPTDRMSRNTATCNSGCAGVIKAETKAPILRLLYS